MEDRTLRLLRTMAWERAKGELNSMLHSYYSTNSSESYYDQFEITLKKFIEQVEHNGWQE